jgi:Tfp pilus assembly protein FimT
MGAGVLGNRKGFTMVELFVMMLVASVVAATAVPRLVSITGEAATVTGNFFLSTLETANSLTFSRQVAQGLTGAYTMGDVLANMDMRGVEVSEITASSCKVKIQGTWYEFNLVPASDGSLSQGSINMAVVTGGGSSSANTRPGFHAVQ